MTQCLVSRFSGLRFAQSSGSSGISDFRISPEAPFQRSLCHPLTLEILLGVDDRSVLNFLLLFAKQC